MSTVFTSDGTNGTDVDSEPGFEPEFEKAINGYGNTQNTARICNSIAKSQAGVPAKSTVGLTLKESRAEDYGKTARIASTVSGAVSSTVTANATPIRSAGGVKKARVQQQLHRVIEGLTVAQANVLLLQAMSLAAGDSEAGCDRGDYRVSELQSLSKRELEVLVLVANGYNRKSIGKTLGISVNTAARHIANIYSKLGISSVAEATIFACHNNVIGSMHAGAGVPLRQ